MEGDEMARQPIAGDRLTGVNRESAALQSPHSERTSSPDSARAKTARASTRNSAPASVNSMPRPTRSKSFAPWRPSSAAIEELTADCAVLSASAAPRTCWRLAAATKTRSCSSGMEAQYQVETFIGYTKSVSSDPDYLHVVRC